jgi:hypothetical protein
MASDDFINNMNAYSSILQGVGAYYAGRGRREQGKWLEFQHKQNAKRAEIAGEKEASRIREAGRRMISNATVAMVAQGGTVDSAMLARMKTAHDIDAISALYDVKARAATHAMQGEQAARQGRQDYRASVIKMGSSFLDAASTFNRQKTLKDPSKYNSGTGYLRQR